MEMAPVVALVMVLMMVQMMAVAPANSVVEPLVLVEWEWPSATWLIWGWSAWRWRRDACALR